MTRQKRRARGWRAALCCLALLAGGFWCLFYGSRFFLTQAYPVRYSEYVRQEASQYGLDEFLVYSVIRAESSFDPDARSHANAIGLMQLTPATFEWVQGKLGGGSQETAEDLEDPEVNIRYGCKLLSMLLSMYSSEETALSAYNAGVGAVSGWLSDPALSPDGETLARIPYPETERYVEKVLQNRRIYAALYE